MLNDALLDYFFFWEYLFLIFLSTSIFMSVTISYLHEVTDVFDDEVPSCLLTRDVLLQQINGFGPPDLVVLFKRCGVSMMESVHYQFVTVYLFIC